MQGVVVGSFRGGRARPRGPRRHRLGVAALTSSLLASIVVVVAVVPEVAHALQLTVNTTLDEQVANNGACSLKEAILAANNDNNGFPECGTASGADTITFAIPGGAPGVVHTITTSTGMPGIVGTLTIDGTTETGYDVTQPVIEITNTGGANTLSMIGSTNSVVKGLILNGAASNAAAILPGNGTFIQGNWIGTDDTGSAAQPNGIGIYAIAASNLTVGSSAALPSALDRNVISGNGTGIVLAGNLGVKTNNTLIHMNFIGTDKTGTAAVPNTTGVQLQTDVNSTTIRTNVISGNITSGVDLNGTGITGTTLYDNTIGLNLAQNGALPNNDGVTLTNGPVSNTHIGLNGAGVNVIAGNTNNGITVAAPGLDTTFVWNNLIGISPTNTVFPNFIGVEVLVSDVTIGGTSATFRNVISGNTVMGIKIQDALAALPDVVNTQVLGNFIGTNLAGTGAAVTPGTGTGTGVYLGAGFGVVRNSVIGDGTAGGRNVISSNPGEAISFWDGANNNSVRGNYIGVGFDGTTSLGNNLTGLGFGNIVTRNGASNNTIGGTVAGEGNLIANNNGAGVQLFGGTGNRIVRNSFFANTGFAIDLVGASVNDAGDFDSGVNNRQNFPVVSAAISAGTLTASYSIDSGTASSTYPIDIDFYKADSGASGEGKTFLATRSIPFPASNTDDPLGNAATLGVANGDYIVATATDAAGNTSMFSSPALVVPSALTVVVNNAGDAADAVPGNGICETTPGGGICTLRAAIQETNLLAGANSINFNVAGSPVTITPVSDLPAITGPLTIDASTQSGSNCGVSPQVLSVELNASNETGGAGLRVNAGSLFLRGMVVNRYRTVGVFLATASSGSRFECNFIGTDRQGMNPSGYNDPVLGFTAETGIYLDASNGNTIGGPATGQGNLIAGYHSFEQITLVSSNNNVIQGNILGTGSAGVIGGFNTRGIILNGNNNLVGGTGPGDGNVITGAAAEGIISFSGTGNAIRGNRIFGNGLLGIDLYSAPGGVTFNHDPLSASQPPVGSPNGFQNYPVLTVATSTIGSTRLQGTLTSTPTRTFQIDVFANPVCDATSFGEGANYLGTFPVTTDASGVATFDNTLPAGFGEPFGISTTATDMTTGSTSEFSYCRPASTPNLTWVTAQPLTLGTAHVEQFITDNLQEKWFKVPVNPGDKVKLQLTGAPGSAVSLHRDPQPFYNTLTNPSSAAALSAEAADTAFLPSGSLPSGSLPSGSLPSGSLPSGSLPSGSLERGFLPSGSLPSGSLPSGSLPSGSLPSGSLPSGSLPSGSLPSGSLPSGSLPSGSLPSGSLPSGSLPSGSLPSGSLPSGSLPSGSLDAYSSASRRSLMGISMDPYAQVQTIERTTFDLQENLYVRVVGPYSLTNSFKLDVTVTPGVCGSLSPITGSVIVGAQPTDLDRQTVIVTDQSKLGGTPTERSAAMASLTTLMNRSDVNGVLVDLSDTARFPRVAAANAQATANPGCPVAKNTVAKEIKAVIDAYRAVNQASGATTLQYVVLAGGADVIPFYQVQDVAGLASEKDYVPPVKPETPSEAGLRSGLVKGQDFYGSSADLTIAGRTLNVPDLAVGRLVDTALDITAAVNAYVATNGVVTPSTALVTGYDFVGDAAAQVQTQFTQATLNTDTLIQPPGQGSTGPNAWSADQLRTKLLARNNGVMMLSGHFSAGTLLASDYRTSLSAAEISASAANFTNSVILALGCHGGFALPSTDLLAGASPDPDWAKTFMRKGAAAYVAATGYAYGDTELTEYGERLFLGLTKQMRTGTGAIPMGKALVEAKRDYIAGTAQLTGIDEKTIVEMTLYGLPMMKVNMPGPRLTPPAEPSVVTSAPAAVPGAPVALTSTTVHVAPTLNTNTVSLTNLNTAAATQTTYLSGPDGVVANPFEPVLPKKIDNVTVTNQVLRGVALRGGDYTDVANIIPLTTAPTTETSRPHQSFNTDVFYPSQVWVPNFYDAVAGGDGKTRLVTVPAQYKSNAPGSVNGTLRKYTGLDLALYYMPSNWTSAGSPATKGAAVSAGPSITGVSATAAGSTVTFDVTAVTDGSAGVQSVWVLYTADSGSFYGHWASVDLQRDPNDITKWIGTMNIGATPASAMKFMVQAVNGAGLTALATNLGGYYGASSSTTPPVAATTGITVTGPTSGTYLTAQTFSTSLTTPGVGGTGVSGQTVVFDIGGQQASALTDANGVAAVTITPVVTPGPYAVQVSSKPTSLYASSTASAPFTVTKANTAITLTGPAGSVVSGQATGITASLKDGAGREVAGKSIVFVVTGTSQTVVRAVPGDNLGRALLPALTLPAGTYSVKAYFSGTVPGVTPPLVLTDDSYNPSQSTAVSLTINPAVVPNQAPVVRADMGVAGLQEIGYQSNVIVLAGSFTDADGTGPFTASVRWTPTGAFTPFVLNNNTDFIALYVYPSAGTRVATVKVCDKLGACGTDDVTIRSNVTQKVTPVRECVTDRGATNPRYSARFGYNNPATFPIYIPTLLSAENGFSSLPFLRGQPQVFLAGNQRNVFTTTFNSGSISWKLNGTKVTANSSSPRC